MPIFRCTFIGRKGIANTIPRSLLSPCGGVALLEEQGPEINNALVRSVISKSPEQELVCWEVSQGALASWNISGSVYHLGCFGQSSAEEVTRYLVFLMDVGEEIVVEDLQGGTKRRLVRRSDLEYLTEQNYIRNDPKR